MLRHGVRVTHKLAIGVDRDDDLPFLDGILQFLAHPVIGIMTAVEAMLGHYQHVDRRLFNGSQYAFIEDAILQFIHIQKDTITFTYQCFLEGASQVLAVFAAIGEEYVITRFCHALDNGLQRYCFLFIYARVRNFFCALLIDFLLDLLYLRCQFGCIFAVAAVALGNRGQEFLGFAAVTLPQLAECFQIRYVVH